MKEDFRVWVDGKMLYTNDFPSDYELTFNRNAGWCVWQTISSGRRILIGGKYGPSVVDIMRSTGLKDSKDQIIYEGDYLKGTKIAIVRFTDILASFDCYYSAGIEPLSCFVNYGCVEVIGNIYQRPKSVLLEV